MTKTMKKSKKLKQEKTAELPDIRTATTMTPLKTDRMCAILKDISAQRAKELGGDKQRVEQMSRLVEEAKGDFMDKVIPELMVDGEVMADDILAILTAMALSLASEVFEHNDEIMLAINLPDENANIGKPMDIKKGVSIYG